MKKMRGSKRYPLGLIGHNHALFILKPEPPPVLTEICYMLLVIGEERIAERIAKRVTHMMTPLTEMAARIERPVGVVSVSFDSKSLTKDASTKR